MKSYKRFIALICALDIWLICAGLIKFNGQESVIKVNTEKTVAMADIDEEEKLVVPSGEPIGIYVKSEGVMIIGIGQIMGADGNVHSPCESLVSPGDYILSIEGKIIEDKAQLTAQVNSSGGRTIDITVQRKSKTNQGSIYIETITVTPVLDEDGNYMLGLWVKDDISGIGTLTYYDEDSFGALGHSINDNDTGEIFEICDGAIYEAELINIVKSNTKLPGRLEGMIDYSSDNMLGRVEDNSTYGIGGYITENGREKLIYSDYMPVASREELKLGEAYLLSAVSGQPEYYTVEIQDIVYEDDQENKELKIKITDSRLIELTSGIVQGMSGTPIIQNGKLIGAVTHVLVSDPTLGYGIFIGEMME